MAKPSILKRAIVGFVAGQPVGIVLYGLFGLINTAVATTIVDPLVAYALGLGTAIGLQFVEDIKG